MRGISNLVEWLSEGLQDNPAPDVHRNLERIQTRVTRMERIIDDLLVYARAGVGSSKLTMVQPEALIADVLELETFPPGFDVSFEVTAQPFMTAQTPLETVLRNLISNAVKHHDRPVGHIMIKVYDDQSYCHFKVRDDGPGIPSSAQTRVFKLFQTASSSQHGGSGVGLAISRRLVESHGGKITLVSSDNVRGSTFHVLWPRFQRTSRVQQRGAAAQRPGMSSPPHRTQPIAILLVDDDEVDREKFRRLLARSGLNASVVEATSGREAMLQLSNHAFDCIVLDYQLGDVTGIDLVQSIKQTVGRATPLIMITGLGDERIAVDAMRLGIYDYVLKSELSAHGIASAIEGALRFCRLEAQLKEARERAVRQSLFDNLTSLPNRNLFLSSDWNACFKGLGAPTPDSHS